MKDDIIPIRKMKAILEFSLPEDQKDFNAAVKAQDMAMVLWDINYNLRKEVERQLDTLDETLVTPYQAIDIVFTKIYERLERRGILVDELTE
jgi:DNA polymerase I-like protein with 3'-5' exonuclease and polymerase domains